MRIAALAVLASATILAAMPAQAQTYDPDYPVCLQIFAPDGGNFECAYTSLPQCAQSASGRAAACVVNPFYAGSRGPEGPYHRRHRRH